MPSFWDVKQELTRPAKREATRGEPREATRDEPRDAAEGDADAAWSVSDLTKRINAALKGGLPGEILVRGEIGRWSRYGSSGHCYFSLKDDDAVVEAKMWKGAAASLAFEPREGQEVIVAGRVEVWAPRGQLSLIASRIDPVGQGAMELAFRQLVEKLKNEGLFEPSRKRPLPGYPGRICVVTSPKAAGYQDVLKVLRRFPHLELALYPVPVQGQGAAAKIAAALRDVSANRNDFDVLLLCRGGGSAEDLWCFNEEIVARALAQVPFPTITGIGHETDRSVADFVADHMAHTPTEAAQTLVSSWRTAADRLEQLGVVLRRDAREAVRSRREGLTNLQRHETFRRPTEVVERLRQRVDDRGQALSLALRRRTRAAGERVGRLSATLAGLHPLHRVRLQRQQIDALARRLAAAAGAGESSRRASVESLRRQLAALDPTAVLGRGYTITRLRRDGRLVRDPGEVRPGDVLLTLTAGGDVTSTAGEPAQGELFPPPNPRVTPA